MQGILFLTTHPSLIIKLILKYPLKPKPKQQENYFLLKDPLKRQCEKEPYENIQI